MNLAQLDDPRLRRRAMAASLQMLADTIERHTDGSRDLGVPPPRILTPRTCRDWAARVQAANAVPRAEPARPNATTQERR